MTGPLAGLLTGIIIIIPGPADPGQPQQPGATPQSVAEVAEVAPGPVVILPPLAQIGVPGTPAQPAGVGVGGGSRVNLAGWKLTLPVGAKGKPAEVTRPRPDSPASGPWFGETGDRAVVFRAPVNGVTTKGSKNPRSELREMAGDGSTPAAWSSTSGTHTMRVVEAFTRLPTGKPHLVGAQIHDAADDVSVFRLEGSDLYVTDGDNPHYKLITNSYRLGTPFEAKFVVSGGQVRAFYNGALVATLAKNFSGAYFKAGAYTQANCTNAAPCSAGNYGETVIYDLQVTHSG